MRSEEVVVLQSRESGQNVPFEFIIAAVDERGVLRQFGGVDEDIAHELLGICQERVSLVIRDDAAAQRLRIVEAQARGEVPEEMARNAVERYGTAPQIEGELPEKPQGLGQKPIVLIESGNTNGPGDALPE